MRKKIEIKGICANPGYAEGPAHVIHDVKDISKLLKTPNNSILVCPFTTPLFAVILRRVKGIVTDLGGLTSHAAIVARELGIPCVVGTEKATKIIPDKAKVIINNEKVIVEIL